MKRSADAAVFYSGTSCEGPVPAVICAHVATAPLGTLTLGTG